MTAVVENDQQSDAWATCLSDTSTGEMGLMFTGWTAGIGQGSCSTNGPALSDYTPQQDTSTYSYSGGTTAEWIAEDPSSLNDNMLPLANFGTATFSGISMVTPSTMVATDIVKGGQIQATPGPLSNNSFTVAYTGP
jgi:hypothetical protein